MLTSKGIDDLAPDQRKAYDDAKTAEEFFAASKSAAPTLIEPAPWQDRIISGIVNVAPGETLAQRMHTIRSLIFSMQRQLLDRLDNNQERMIMQADGLVLLLIPKQLLDQINATQNHQGN
jgi:hypothetical protein